MVRVVKIYIGSNHVTEKDLLRAILRTFWPGDVQYTIHVQKVHTLVVFAAKDAPLQLLENVSKSVAGVDNVRSEELTPEEALTAIAGVDGLEYLEDILTAQAAGPNPAENRNPAD